MLRRVAFTLVELLVVVAIISVLIAILLPVVAGARRQAEAVRCATQLREVGHAFHLYALDNRGYYPPSQLEPLAGNLYNVDGVNYQPGNGAYWFNFLAKYVTKARMGNTATSATEAATARATVFWGCSAWEPYRTAASPTGPFDGIIPTQPGYGMTYWPDASPTQPAETQYPTPGRSSFIRGWSASSPTSITGKWWKQKTYTANGSIKALVADSRFWALNSDAAPEDGILPRQPALHNTDAYNGPNQTLADLYRHGRFPPLVGEQFANRGGRVAFNILYGDGHVATTGDWREAYRAVRMRFPG